MTEKEMKEWVIYLVESRLLPYDEAMKIYERIKKIMEEKKNEML